jgi:hypothetical protein
MTVALKSTEKEEKDMAKAILKTLIILAMLLGTMACGSEGVDNGISSTVGSGNQGEPGIDKGPGQAE